MPTTEIRKFDGLYLQANSFDVPDGALEIAENVVIQSDHVISKSKGFYEWWRPGGGDTLHDVKGLFIYQGYMIGAFLDGVGWFQNQSVNDSLYNKIGFLNALPGVDSSFGASVYFATANQNLYMTGTNGNFAIEEVEGTVRRVGVPPALSMSYNDEWTDIGVLPPDSQTSYRTVFGRRDNNGNLLLSAPSDYLYIGMPAPLTGLAYTITSNICYVTVPNDYLVNDVTGLFRDGEQIIVSAATNALLNGSHTIIYDFPFDFHFNIVQPDGSGTLTISANGTPTITAEIPSEISGLEFEWFVQFYRSTSSLGVAVGTLLDWSLASEQVLTAEDFAVGFTRFIDTVSTELLGAELYTNPNSREGEGQANTRPPWANVIASYKNYMLYSDVKTVQRMTLNMINSPALFTSRTISFLCDGVTETYIDSFGPGHTVRTTPVFVTGTGTGVITVMDDYNFPNVGDRFIIYDITGTLPPGKYTVLTAGGAPYTFSAPGFTMTAGTVEFYRAGSGEFFFTADFDTAESARSLVTSINRNSSFMYANYNGSFEAFPGEFMVQSKQPTSPIYVKVSLLLPDHPIFIQPVPDSFVTGKQVYSENDVLKNAMFISKVGEPEAVPVLNFLSAGNASSRILATIALRDAVIIVKEDGAFKLSGDTIADFQIVPLDTTVKFYPAARIAGNINNQVLALSNQGIVSITESSVQVISRRIDDGIQPLAGKELFDTFVGGNEADRLFYVNTSGVNEDDPDVCWVYNVLNQTWTTSTEVLLSLTPGIEDATFGILFDPDVGGNVIHRQRKTQTLVDYTGKYCYGDVTPDPSKLTASYVITGGNTVSPGVGDVLLYNNVFSRIIKSVAGGGGFTLTFASPTNLPVSVVTSEVFLFKAYRSSIKMAPFHAGQVTLSKHFSEMQIHLRQPAISDIKLSFAGAYFGSSELTNWSLANISSAGSTGWGNSPWGFFPWGLANGIRLNAGTQSSTIIRTYVPRFAARNTWIQAMMTHAIAGQPMLIQALGFTVRGYNQRTSK